MDAAAAETTAAPGTEPKTIINGPAATDPTQARSFSQLIQQIENGALHQDLSNATRDMIAALHDHMAANGGKPSGEINLALAFKLDSGTVEVQADVRVRTPKTKRERSIFWATPDNHLTRTNPRQLSMFEKRARE